MVLELLLLPNSLVGRFFHCPCPPARDLCHGMALLNIKEDTWRCRLLIQMSFWKCVSACLTFSGNADKLNLDNEWWPYQLMRSWLRRSAQLIWMRPLAFYYKFHVVVSYCLLCTPILLPHRAAGHHILVKGHVSYFVLSRFVWGESIFKTRFDGLALMSKLAHLKRTCSLKL